MRCANKFFFLPTDKGAQPGDRQIMREGVGGQKVVKFVSLQKWPKFVKKAS